MRGLLSEIAGIKLFLRDCSVLLKLAVFLRRSLGCAMVCAAATTATSDLGAVRSPMCSSQLAACISFLRGPWGPSALIKNAKMGCLMPSYMFLLFLKMLCSAQVSHLIGTKEVEHCLFSGALLLVLLLLQGGW